MYHVLQYTAYFRGWNASAAQMISKRLSDYHKRFLSFFSSHCHLAAALIVSQLL